MREFERIPEERKKALTKLALWVRTQLDAGQTPKLVFICTHNSRRSHISQLWSEASASVFGVEGVESFSGGTEVTAFNPRAVAAMQRAGFEIAKKADGDNPRYVASYGPKGRRIEAFSKVYKDAPNPDHGFAAIMTCGQADKSCPTVQGAAFRVAIPYEDPKASDGTPDESATYDQRVAQVARELLFAYSKVAR
ncbi:MAG: protein-tyrosine-phosphatase [Myxococcales bacterium]|nr:protein-tyrosine-phosphatase [Myxococcales bacterium]